jgi:beta-mannosidase
MSDYMARDLPQASDLESWSYLSQVNQAEGMALGIRAHRFSKPYCMGTLYWQLNDCWPGISWSGMEYGGRWKALHHKVKHLYQPILCSVEFEENQLELYIVSDLANSDSVGIKLSIVDLDGRNHYHWVSQVLISPDAPVRLLGIDISEIIRETGIRNIFALVEWNYGPVSDYQLTALAPLKSVPFKKPDLTIQDIKQNQDGYEFMLSSDQIAKSVFLHEKDDWRVHPNFVDLVPGKPILVKLLTSQANLTKEEIKIRSLFDFQNINK